MKKLQLLTLAGVAIMGMSTSILIQAADLDYAVNLHWTLGEPSKWDYADIDAVRRRLFVTRGDRVQVLELPSGNPIGEISNTQGVHGVAFAQDQNIGFTSNGRTDSVTVFDLDTLQVKQEIKVTGSNPDALLYEDHSHKLFVFNGKTANVTVIDTLSLKVIATIATTGRPEFAVSDNAGKIFFNIEDKAELHAIDVASNTLISKWPLKGCEEPTGLAIDIARARLFSVCQNKTMVVTDAKNGRFIAHVAIGEHPDAVIYDPETANIFSSNGDGGGSLTIIHQDDANHYVVKGNVITAPGAKTMAMDLKTKTIYLPTVIDKKFLVLVAGKK
ncbi:YVTN family beta-propeller protein [Undibacterium sp. GrIS 1.2]|uniref:YncE family protein n=1 Tax=Undibacterium sp. GrIS 1.2 TaxID=3143933 RepID=UPI00339A3222